MDSSPAGSSVHGSLQATILEWVAMPSSAELPDPGNESVSRVSCIGRWVLATNNTCEMYCSMTTSKPSHTLQLDSVSWSIVLILSFLCQGNTSGLIEILFNKITWENFLVLSTKVEHTCILYLVYFTTRYISPPQKVCLYASKDRYKSVYRSVIRKRQKLELLQSNWINTFCMFMQYSSTQQCKKSFLNQIL